MKGGHSNCDVYCNTSSITSHMCEGHMTSCSGCNLAYCEYHSQQVGKECFKGGHVCRTTGSNIILHDIKVLFDEPVIPPVQDAEENIHTLALIACNVYYLTDDNNRRLEEGSQSINNVGSFAYFTLDLSDYECIRDSIVDEAGSCGMAVWRNKFNGIRILSIKGTSADRFTDIALDAGN